MMYRFLEAHDAQGWYCRAVAVNDNGGVAVYVPGHRKADRIEGRTVETLTSADIPQGLRLDVVREAPARYAKDPHDLFELMPVRQ